MAAPDNPRAIGIVEEVSNSNVIPGENQFLFRRVPNCECPISRESCESVGAPSVEGSRNNSYVRSIRLNVIVELGYQFVSIVEPTIPGDPFSRGRDVWLVFKAGLRGRMERSIQHAH